MKIKDFKWKWSHCPNCGSIDKIEQKEIENERALFCKECHYFLREGFATFLLMKKNADIEDANEEYDVYLPKA